MRIRNSELVIGRLKEKDQVKIEATRRTKKYARNTKMIVKFLIRDISYLVVSMCEKYT